MEVLDIGSVLLLYGFTVAAAVQDIVRMKIRNRLILMGLAAALICRILREGATALLPYLGNIIFPVIVLYLLYLAGILGAGDVKLFSVIGGFVSFRELVYCMFLSFSAGAFLAFIRMTVSRSFRIRIMRGFGYLSDIIRGNWHPYPSEEDDVQSTGRMHFSVAIAAGLVISQVYLRSR